jgi:hypothetical protein
METPLVIDSEDAVRLASALSELTGESLTETVAAALSERLAREMEARERAAARNLARAIAMNVSREGRLLDCVPAYGWCSAPGGLGL